MEQFIGNKGENQNTDGSNKRAYVYCGYSRNDHNMQCRTEYDVYTDYLRANTTHGVGLKCYNTGKVLIGSRYQPPAYREESAHMLRLQRGLLEERTERRTVAASDLALYLVGAIAFIVIYLTR